jgi:hypothetical protein
LVSGRQYLVAVILMTVERLKEDRMATERQSDVDAGQPTIYHLRVGGHLGRHWSDWFDGLAVTTEADGTTLLAGEVADQAALHGLLRKMRDLGLPLLSVVRVTPER